MWIKNRDGSTVNLILAELSVADRAVVLDGNRQAEFKDRYRTWTNSSGKYSVVAKAMAVEPDGVQLRRVDDKRIVTVPLVKLSEADRAFAVRLVEAAQPPSSKFASDGPFESARSEPVSSTQSAPSLKSAGAPKPSALWPAGRALTQSVTSAAQDVSSVALTHWLNSDTGVRHNRSCRWYGKTKSGRPCSASEGSACGQCGG